MIQFRGIEGENGIPGAIIYTNDYAGVKDLRYVPEVVEPKTVFKPGQIVEVILEYSVRPHWHGVVIKVNETHVEVEFGRARPGENRTHSYQPSSLKLIHEAN